MLRHSALGLAVLVALSACGGGGSTVSTLPKVPVTPSTSAAQRIMLSIKIPAGATGAAALNRRRPLYVSSATQSAAIAVNGGTPVVVNLAAGSSNCVAAAGGRTCSITISAPVGVDTFAESLYASTNGSGTALSQNTTTATIVASTANVVTLTLDGVVASIVLSLTNAAPPVGPTATIGLTVNAIDAGGATIIGNDPFENPITVTNSDTTKITTLSKSTVNSPADVVTITYNGQPLSSATFSASAAGVSAARVTLSPQAPAQIGFNDYATFGFDNQRDVFNPNSTAITPTNLPHVAWQSSLGDFNTPTQPVLATEIPGHAGVLFVGGAYGNVYAYDALKGTLLWKKSTGNAVYTACGGNSYLGIGGTVAYDAATKSLYVVGNMNPVPDAYASNTLYRLDAATGNILGQVNFAPAQVGTSEFNFAHTAVTLSNGVAYVGTGSTCDISSWRGSVVAINVPSMTVANRFFTLWDPQNSRGSGAQPWGGGGVWGWGGVVVDFSGNILTGVGNADNGSPQGAIASPFALAPQEYSGYAETLLKLSSDLSTVLASNHPIPVSTYGGNSVDLDVQGTPLIFQPNGAGCGTMVALQGKSGEFNMYNESTLSGGPVAQYQLSGSNWDDAYLGDPAYSPATGLLYAPVASQSLYAPGLVAINPGCGHPSVTWHAAFGSDSSSTGLPRSVPAVSAGGVVFAGTLNGTGGYVWAVDASTGTVLNGGNPLLQTSGNMRLPVTIDGNWLFVLDYSGNLYGLTTDPSYAAIQTKYRAPDARSRKPTNWFRRR
jgi:outer membrane protein assembly factor BamB